MCLYVCMTNITNSKQMSHISPIRFCSVSKLRVRSMPKPLLQNRSDLFRITLWSYSILTQHITLVWSYFAFCVSFNSWRPSDAYMRRNTTNLDSDNGLLTERRQAIIWTNVGILLIGPLRTNVSEFLIWIHTFSFKKMHLKTASANWRHFVSASMC